jgi:hypothetical protein
MVIQFSFLSFYIKVNDGWGVQIKYGNTIFILSFYIKANDGWGVQIKYGNTIFILSFYIW